MTQAIDFGHMSEDELYRQYLDALSFEFSSTFKREPLFTTDAQLWDAYLDSFPVDRRQYHNCNACRRFIENYGGLVTIDADVKTKSALWHIEDNGELRDSIRAMRKLVERATVTGIFVTSDAGLGNRTMGMKDKSNPASDWWNHLSVSVPASRQHSSRVQTAHQLACEKLEDVSNVTRALVEFDESLLRQAVALLESDALYRSEKVLGPAKWLLELQVAQSKTHNLNLKHRLVFRAVASAPAGFCHPRSSMIGTLLEDLASGNGFDYAASRFKSKMHPLQYQRPTALPNDGQIAAAEKLVEQLGIARSLERRFARLDDVVTIWKPQQKTEPDKAGVFGHLRADKQEPKRLSVSTTSITRVKFAATVLPTARKIEVNAPSTGSYCAYVTATHSDAPPILQWDTDGNRLPVSWYLKSPTGYASGWGVVPGWQTVTAIAPKPSMIGGKCAHHGNGQLFVIGGCVDKENYGSAIFPEILKSELHGCRSVIEAHSNKTPLTGRENASACGLMFFCNNPIEVRVTGDCNIVTRYTIDRWD